MALLALGAAMSFTPGPNTALSAALAANGGWRAAWRFVCAVPAGWSILLTLSTLGLGSLLLAWPAGHTGLQVLGAGYLAWLAWRLSRARHLPTAPDTPQTTGTHEVDGAPPQARTGGQIGTWHIGFWQGVALQLVNIKAWMLTLTFTTGWIAGHMQPGQRFAIVLPVLLAFAFFSNLTYALAGALLRQWLARGARLLWFNRAMATTLLVTACWMLIP